MSVLSAIWWRWHVNRYLQNKGKMCQREGRSICKELEVRKNSCGIVSSSVWWHATAKGQGRVSSKRWGWKICEDQIWFGCFYSFLSNLELFLRIKGKTNDQVNGWRFKYYPSSDTYLNCNCLTITRWVLVFLALNHYQKYEKLATSNCSEKCRMIVL